jgi:hypothetical protein
MTCALLALCDGRTGRSKSSPSLGQSQFVARRQNGHGGDESQGREALERVDAPDTVEIPGSGDEDAADRAIRRMMISWLSGLHSGARDRSSRRSGRPDGCPGRGPRPRSGARPGRPSRSHGRAARRCRMAQRSAVAPRAPPCRAGRLPRQPRSSPARSGLPRRMHAPTIVRQTPLTGLDGLELPSVV